jgi:hypothetical protein
MALRQRPWHEGMQNIYTKAYSGIAGKLGGKEDGVSADAVLIWQITQIRDLQTRNDLVGRELREPDASWSNSFGGTKFLRAPLAW